MRTKDIVVKTWFKPIEGVLLAETPEKKRLSLQILENMAPAELMLVALGGCAAIDLFKALSLRGAEIQSIEIELIGRPVKEGESSYIKEVSISYVITAQNVGRREVKEVIHQSLEKYCSIAVTLSRSINIRPRSITLKNRTK
jgi:uncharacterized OsmC-like protein